MQYRSQYIFIIGLYVGFHIPSKHWQTSFSELQKTLFAKKRTTAKVNSRKYLNLTYSTIQNNQEVEDSVDGCKVRACVSHVFLWVFFFSFFPRKTSMLDVHKAPQCAAAHGGILFFLSFLEGWHTKYGFTVEGEVAERREDILCSGAEWALVRTQAKKKKQKTRMGREWRNARKAKMAVRMLS